MSNKKQLIIKLLPDGKIQMETAGVKGKKCLDYIKMVEQLADVKIIKQEYTNEFYENEEDINIFQDQEINTIRQDGI